MLFSQPFALLARRKGRVTAWLVLLGRLCPDYRKRLPRIEPRSRVSWALGIELPAEARIKRLKQIDSFNDGITVWGAVYLNDDAVKRIVQKHGLTEEVVAGRIRQYMRDVDLPEYGLGFGDGLLSLYHDEESNLLHFVRRFSEHRP